MKFTTSLISRGVKWSGFISLSKPWVLLPPGCRAPSRCPGGFRSVVHVGRRVGEVARGWGFSEGPAVAVFFRLCVSPEVGVLGHHAHPKLWKSGIGKVEPAVAHAAIGFPKKASSPLGGGGQRFLIAHFEPVVGEFPVRTVRSKAAMAWATRSMVMTDEPKAFQTTGDTGNARQRRGGGVREAHLHGVLDGAFRLFSRLAAPVPGIAGPCRRCWHGGRAHLPPFCPECRWTPWFGRSNLLGSWQVAQLTVPSAEPFVKRVSSPDPPWRR